MGSVVSDGLNVSLVDCPEARELESEWRALEAQAEASFFISWTWIGCWLSRLEPALRPRLLRAERGDRVVGLGLVVAHRCFRLRAIPLRCLQVHATGDPRHDDITIEHNALLVAKEGSATIEEAMLGHLCSPGFGWDSIFIPGVSAMPPLDGLSPLNMVTETASSPAYAVDLDPIRSGGGDYLGQVSRNTRSQIRRGVKAYEQFGSVKVSLARDKEEALLFLSRLKDLHQRTWTARGQAGAFANPLFEVFHAGLIERGMAQGQIFLLRVHAGDQDIGYLYNFAHEGTISAYQSGFNYGLLEKNSHPGLVSHALAIQHFLDAGYSEYDFLAGDSRYKRQLATRNYDIVTLSIHRNNLSRRLQKQWRALKHRLRPAQGAESSAQEESEAA
jgi:CelD/BcsL family acetyltransferase involved in cellulose biosynthesis